MPKASSQKTTKPAAGQPGVITSNVISLRASADSDTECVTQALIGQPVIAEGGQKDWYYVQTWDTYRGWIPSRAIRLFEDRAAPAYASNGPVAIIRELWCDIHEQPNDKSMILTKATVSAELQVVDSKGDWVELELPDLRKGFIRKKDAKLVDKQLAQTIWLPDPEKMIETAMRFIGVPYLWGGTSPFGIDCSGFVQLVHRIHGITLLRDAHMQAGDPRCQRVERGDVRTGDLVFFGKTPEPDLKAVTHIGMAMDNDWFIHSGGRGGVQVTRFDDPTSPYVNRYWGARRMRYETLDVGGGAPED
ncbi:MAG: NlpC/P60 family protein [Armatimonadota bacterium]|jgi:hypothetical protein